MLVQLYNNLTCSMPDVTFKCIMNVKCLASIVSKFFLSQIGDRKRKVGLAFKKIESYYSTAKYV